MNPLKRVWNNIFGYQDVYECEWEIELLKIMGKSLNMSLDIETDNKKEYRTGPPAIYVRRLLCEVTFYENRVDRIFTQLPHYTFSMLHAVCCKIKKVQSLLRNNLYRRVDLVCFVTGIGCHYSPLHFKLRTQITLARIQVLQQHFQCHSQYYSRFTVSVCKHTITLYTATSALLLLDALQCCDQQSVPGVLHHISDRTGIKGTYQNCRTKFKPWKEIRF
jgi:hypothetical protein